MFNIAQLVILNDGTRARVMSETSPRRWLVCRLGTGTLETLPEGDLALPGEDRDVADRERSAQSWHASSANGVVYDRHGNYYRQVGPADGQA